MPDPVANEQLEALKVGEIIVSNRLRPVDQTAVDALQASFEEFGALSDAIHVRRTDKGDVLIDGAHRLALAKRLGWDTIEAKIWRCNGLQARLLEVDAGIAGAELNHLDLALFLAERKRVYEELHPEARNGHKGASARWENATATMAEAFTDQVSKSRDMSARTVQRLVRIGTTLTKDDIDALRDVPDGAKLKDLEELAKISDEELRGLAIGSLVDGEAKSIRDAASLHSTEAKPPEKSNEEKRFEALRAAWRGSTKLARKRFLRDFGDEVRAMLSEAEPSEGDGTAFQSRRGAQS